MGTATLDERDLAEGDEAGTAPGDRRFRPDVEGLRAVAVGLVVLYHANLPGLTGGFVGVDVFFVISGFVITGLLLRERAGTGRTSILAFYGRRCRRIIPAATLVILVTVVASYAVLGVAGGGRAAVDGNWAAVFLANFHFAAVGTNYLTAQLAPSPLQNFWSLSVEEQFYLVYPTLFLLVARMPWGLTLRARLAIGLAVAIAASFALSVVQTSTDAGAAYFSPFTRAWELALGALVAVGTPALLRLTRRLAAAMTWAGLAAIVFAAFFFTISTPYPGWHVAVPVVGTALVIAGGTGDPGVGAELVLGAAPLRWLGRLSYSLYLWHWPILVLAVESSGRTTLPLPQTMGWLLVALGAAAVTYRVVENPVRHAAFARRSRVASIALGLGLVAVTVVTITILFESHGGDAAATGPAVARDTALSQVEQLVAAAPAIRSVAPDLDPSLGSPWVGTPGDSSGCWPSIPQTSLPTCVFGDPRGTRTMALYGDSHAGMWFDALNDIAQRAHWKLIYLGKGYCPAGLLPYGNPSGWGTPGGEFQPCDEWHRFAIDRINRLRPELVIVSQEYRPAPDGKDYSRTQWQRGLEAVWRAITVPGVHFDVIGNIPHLPQPGPDCLSRNPNDVQRCTAPLARSRPDPGDTLGEKEAANGFARYIDVTPWFCTDVCSATIGRYGVYYDEFHVSGPYSEFLEGVLRQALQLPVAREGPSGSPDPRGLIARPADRATLSGITLLAGTATDSVHITRVEFRLTGGSRHGTLVGYGTLTPVGYLTYWRSTSVPNGTYTVQLLVHDAAGTTGRSPPITVTVAN